MTAKFPLSEKKKPGSVYTYDPGVSESYIEESVITDKNIKEAYENILKTAPAPTDKISTKVRVNELGVIVKAEDLIAADLPPHSHTNDSTGGRISTAPRFTDLELLPGVKKYTIPDTVYNNIYGMYINGVFVEEFQKNAPFEIELLFEVDMKCNARLLF